MFMNSRPAVSSRRHSSDPRLSALPPPPLYHRPSLPTRHSSATHEVRRGDFIHATCTYCRGKGNTPLSCKSCGGNQRQCTDCRGSGVVKRQCEGCDGRGKIIRAATLDAQRKRERQLDEEERRDRMSREWGRKNYGVKV